MFNEPDPNTPKPGQGNQPSQQPQGQAPQHIGHSQIERAFTHRNVDASVRECIRQLGSRSFIARKAAAERLGRIGHPAKKAVDMLVHTLNDDHDGVRMEAAKSLGLIGDASAIESLRESVRSERSGRVKDNMRIAINILEGAKQMEHEQKILDEERGRIEQERKEKQE